MQKERQGYAKHPLFIPHRRLCGFYIARIHHLNNSYNYPLKLMREEIIMVKVPLSSDTYN
jgi:hypothetical protein